MGIGAESSFWRRTLLRSFSSIYIRRRCVTAEGAFEAYVSGGSSLKVLDPRGLAVEAVHRRFINKWVQQDSVVWDVGANLGLFAFPAALKASRGCVYAFEPDVDLAANLLRSLRLPRNRGINISPVCLAVSNVDGAANFQISRYSRAMSKLEAAGKWHDQQVSVLETRTVATMSIDTLQKSLAPPSVIKIDVEGGEMEVLEGAELTISEHRPMILIEGPSELQTPMDSFFLRHDYLMFDGAIECLIPLEHSTWDTIAIPSEIVRRGNGRI
jgi:FkbM family methyltransferase